MRQKISSEDKSVFVVDRNIINLFNQDKYIDEIVVILDFKGNILASNRESFTINFFHSFNTENLNLFKIIDSDYQNILLRRLALLKNGQVAPPTEYKLVLKNNKSAYIEVYSSPVTYNNTKAFITLIRDITMRKEIEKKLLYAVVQTEEKERQRFAQDLHDELGPFLSGLKLYLHELNASDISSKRRKELIDYLWQMTDEAVDKVRSLSSNLMPQNMIETGVSGSIEKLINNLNRTGKIKIDLKTKGSETGLVNSFIITLYRIVLELINNSIKHAGSDMIRIELAFGKNSTLLNYKDNGKGFDLVKCLEQGKGIGLRSIMNRIALFQGSYKFMNKAPQGIEFEIQFRLK